MQPLFSRAPAARCSLMLPVRVVKLSLWERPQKVQGYDVHEMVSRSPCIGALGRSWGAAGCRWWRHLGQSEEGASICVPACGSATHWMGVDTLRPKPEIDALPKKLGVHGEHLSRLGPGYDQLTPGRRAALVLGYRGPLPPGVQARHVVEEVTEYRWSCLHRLAHRVVIIDDE